MYKLRDAGTEKNCDIASFHSLVNINRGLRYSTAPGTFTNKFMHLTNYSINKLAQSVGERETPVPKWRLSDLWTHIASHVDVPLIKQRIVDIIIKTVLALAFYVCLNFSSFLSTRYLLVLVRPLNYISSSSSFSSTVLELEI